MCSLAICNQDLTSLGGRWWCHGVAESSTRAATRADLGRLWFCKAGNLAALQGQAIGPSGRAEKKEAMFFFFLGGGSQGVRLSPFSRQDLLIDIIWYCMILHVFAMIITVYTYCNRGAKRQHPAEHDNWTWLQDSSPSLVKCLLPGVVKTGLPCRLIQWRCLFCQGRGSARPVSWSRHHRPGEMLACGSRGDELLMTVELSVVSFFWRILIW